MAISRADFWSFIIELVTRNPNLGTPALKDFLQFCRLFMKFVWVAFELRLKCVLHASKVRLRCIWGAIKSRGGPVKHRCSDMILAAFDRKFDENKDEIPPRACRPPYTVIYPILGFRGSTWIPKTVINQVPGGPPWPEFGMHLPTIPPKVFVKPKGPQF